MWPLSPQLFALHSAIVNGALAKQLDAIKNTTLPLQAGLIPRLFKHLFQRIDDTEKEQVCGKDISDSQCPQNFKWPMMGSRCSVQWRTAPACESPYYACLCMRPGPSALRA